MIKTEPANETSQSGVFFDELMEFLGIDDIAPTIETKEKTKAKRRVDEVNKRLKEIGLSFNGTKKAAWTDERIDKYLSGHYYGSSNPDYAQAYVAYITPQQFLNLTAGGKNITLDMIQHESESYGDIDFEKLGTSSPMMLEISEGKNGAKVMRIADDELYAPKEDGFC